MNLKELVTGVSGDKQFLLGNEAAVRGIIEAGVSIAATYPGTPSSEIGNVLSVLAKDANIYFEFSTNEKVAMEVAATAAIEPTRAAARAIPIIFLVCMINLPPKTIDLKNFIL